MVVGSGIISHVQHCANKIAQVEINVIAYNNIMRRR